MAGCITESDQILMRYTSWWSLSGVPHSKSTISGRFTELCIPAYTNRKSWQNIDFGCVHHCERIKILTFVFPRIHGSPKITGFKYTNRSVLCNFTAKIRAGMQHHVAQNWQFRLFSSKYMRFPHSKCCAKSHPADYPGFVQQIVALPLTGWTLLTLRALMRLQSSILWSVRLPYM